MPQPPVCVTGLGALSPLGADLPSSWRELLAGTIALKTGAQGIASSLADYPVGRACIEEAVEREGMEARQIRRLDPISVQALCAASEALKDAGLEAPVRGARVGVVMGVGFGAAKSHYHIVEMCLNEKAHRMSPFTIPAAMPNSAACNVSIAHGAIGPALTVATACAAGLDATGVGLGLVRGGLVDVAIVGGTESIADNIGVGGMGAARALVRARDGDVGVLRPFDRARKGTVVGEGCAVMILESEAFAGRRGAKVRALLRGYGSGSDAFHITQPRPDGSGAIDVMTRALDSAGMRPGEIGAIFAHGTGTPLNDAMEGQAVLTMFGDSPPLVTSTKGQDGHAMGASGPLNLVFAVRALEEGLVPPTITCTDPDPECGIVPVIGEPARASIGAAMVNAFGFGGHNASLILQRP